MLDFAQRWSELGAAGQRLMLLGAGCAALGLLLRFSAPRVFSAGLGTLLLCGAATVLTLTWTPASITAAMTGLLALAMLLAAFVADRQVEAEAETPRARTRSVSADVFRHCAALLTLLVICLGIGPFTSGWSREMALPIGVALAAIAAVLSRTDIGGVSICAAVGLLAIFGHGLRESSGLGLWLVGLLAALAAVALPLRQVYLNWRHRRNCWLDQPQKLLTALPRSAWQDGVVIGCGVLAAFAGAAAQAQPTTPLWMFVATLGVFGVAHATHQRAIGELGLLLAAGVWTTAGTAWLARGPWSLPIGAALGAWFLFWIARFWSQQLLDGNAWTTTGALVAPALRLARVLAPFSAAISVATALRMTADDSQSIWPMPIVFVSHLMLLIGSARSARQSGAAGGAYAAGAAAIGLAATLAEGQRRWLPQVEFELRWGIALVLAGALFWWITESSHARPTYLAARVGIAIGLIPMVLFALALGTGEAWNWESTRPWLLAGALGLPIGLLTASSRTLAGRL